MPAPISALPYTMKIEYDANGNAIYVGFTNPPGDSSKAMWAIQKLTYDANNNPTDIKWASGSVSYIFIWNNRASYTYS
jgi:hypothetical protein